MEGSEDPELEKLVTQFKTSIRSLNYSDIMGILSKIDSIIGDKFLNQRFVDIISKHVFPLLYPSDSGSSKLRFTIQCVTLSRLCKWSPTSRIEILGSVISIFERYPQEFAFNSCIKQTAIDLVNSCKDFLTLLKEVKNDFSTDTIWSFLIFCYNNTSTFSKPNWELINSLIQDPSTFNSSFSEEVLSFLTYTAQNWGQNPQFAFQFFEVSSKRLQLKLTGVPTFLVDPNSSPKNKCEKIIFITSSHLRESNPATARSLTQIVAQESKIADKIFVCSLYLSLLRNVSSNFHSNLIQRIVNIVRSHQLDSCSAAKIVCICSCFPPPRNFSFLGHFFELFSPQPHSCSMFFGHIAEFCDLLPDNFISSLCNDCLSCIRSSGTNFGVMHLLVRLLKRCQNNPLIAQSMDLQSYIQTLQDSANESTKLTAKCLARLSILRSIPIDFDTRSPPGLELTCLVCSYTLTYQSSVYDISRLYLCFIISRMCGFETPLKTIAEANLDFSDAVIDEENGRTLILATREALKLSRTKDVDVFTPLAESITKMSNFQDVVQSISEFFTPQYCENISPEVLRPLVLSLDRVHSNYEPLRNLLLCVISKHSKKWRDFIDISPVFRAWFFTRVCAPLAMKCSGPFHVCSKIRLDSIEFASMLPAAKKWLTHPTTHETRAAAMNFIRSNLMMRKELAQFVLRLSFSILTRSAAPPFPDIDIPSDPIIDFETFTVAENRTAPSLELSASLKVFTKALDLGIKSIGDNDLDAIHASLKHSKDPRVRIPYLDFLRRLGLRGSAYASQIDPKISVTPFF